MKPNEALTLEAFLVALAQLDTSLPSDLLLGMRQIGEALTQRKAEAIDTIDTLVRRHSNLQRLYELAWITIQHYWFDDLRRLAAVPGADGILEDFAAQVLATDDPQLAAHVQIERAGQREQPANLLDRLMQLLAKVADAIETQTTALLRALERRPLTIENLCYVLQLSADQVRALVQYLLNAGYIGSTRSSVIRKLFLLGQAQSGCDAFHAASHLRHAGLLHPHGKRALSLASLRHGRKTRKRVAVMISMGQSFMNAIRETSTQFDRGDRARLAAWIMVASVPGVFNLAVAVRELEERCKFLPFLSHTKSGRLAVGDRPVHLPPSVFWLTVFLPDRPPITLKLISWAIAFGLTFVTLLNARTEIGSRTYHFKSLYAYFIGIAYEIIADSQTRRAAAFWTDVEDALTASPDLNEGLDYLENYFASDVSLTVQEADSYRDRLAQARTKTSGDEQAKATKTLIKEVRRQDLAYVLLRFEGIEDLVDKYFSAAIHRMRP
ncbi:MAG: hypothetical protein HC895_08910 [Leptolyngbyaceae cyanobacterium SM1_3_5]|nr:hypothetical protein [Leptolyngbyaceae cyanobacterium SM1_3_5]